MLTCLPHRCHPFLVRRTPNIKRLACLPNGLTNCQYHGKAKTNLASVQQRTLIEQRKHGTFAVVFSASKRPNLSNLSCLPSLFSDDINGCLRWQSEPCRNLHRFEYPTGNNTAGTAAAERFADSLVDNAIKPCANLTVPVY